MMAKDVVAPEITKEVMTLASQAEGLAKLYEKYEIKSNPQYEAAADDLKKIKAKMNELETKRKSITSPMDEAKSKVMDFFRVPINRLAAVEQIIKQSLGIWQDEQEKIRKAQEDKLRREAEEKEHKEKERLEKAAAKAEAKGDTAKAEELRAEKEEVHVDAPVVVSSTPEVAGIVNKVTWTYEIVDVSLIPRDFLCVDEKKLGGVARATKGTLTVPGVRFYPEKGIAAGRK